MREILFRGKPTEDFEHFKIFRPDMFKGNFVYGSLVVSCGRYYIVTHAMCSIRSCVNNGTTTMVEVNPETIGQYTGKCDKNGEKIFEGDLVRAMMDYGPAGMMETIAKIHFVESLGSYQWKYFDMDTITIIGNVYDNPDISEGLT